jgi:hypothetical protein
VEKNYAKKYLESELQKMSELSSPPIALAVLGLARPFLLPSVLNRSLERLKMPNHRSRGEVNFSHAAAADREVLFLSQFWPRQAALSILSFFRRMPVIIDSGRSTCRKEEIDSHFHYFGQVLCFI